MPTPCSKDRDSNYPSARAAGTAGSAIAYSFLFLLLMLPNTLTTAQNLPDQTGRTIAILDVTARNSEVSKNVYSLEHICLTIGVPYQVTTVVSNAVKYPFVIVSSDINNTFNPSEINELKNFVNSGGILMAPFVKDPAVFSLFGISGFKLSTTNFTMDWIDTVSPELRWIDDPLEKTMSLAEPWHPLVNTTISYTTTTAVTLARFPRYGENGVTRNAMGKGFAYCLGFSFQDLIFYPQIDKDIDAERQYGSGFEPTSDVLMLFIKGIYARFIPYAAWKHTLPYNNAPVFVLTHDIDLETSMVVLNDFSTWERCNNIHATYFITTHYVADYQNPNYYDGYFPQMKTLARQGLEIGSHSVGHLRDFAKLPMGNLGNTKQSYRPYDGKLTSTGGSVLGELEVSKGLLQTDIGIQVRSFRPGFLDDPFEIGKALDTTGYTFSSLHSANDVMTNFPYRLAKKREVTTDLSRVLEIPISLFTDPKQTQDTDSLINKINLVSGKVYANYAPFIVLLHSTNLYKLSVQKKFIGSLSPRTAFMDIGELGDYWLNREAFRFIPEVKNDSMVLTIPDTSLPVNEQMSLVISNGRNLKSLKVMSQGGQPLPYLEENFESNDLLVYFREKPANTTSYPVPTIGGPTVICLGSGAVQYTTDPGMTGYSWTLSPGGSIISGAGSDTVSVQWSTSGGHSVSVTYSSDLGCTAASPAVKNILVHPLPAAPALSGPATVCENVKEVAYSTDAGMSEYKWSVPKEGTIVSGSNTNTILVNWNTPGTGEIGVNYTNPDGCIANAPTKQTVTVKPLPGLAGPVTGSAVVCEGTMGVTYTVQPIENATNYVWSLPAGASIVSGDNSPSIMVNYNAGSVSGTISVHGTNSCGKSNTSQLPVTVKPLTKPAGDISGPVSACNGSSGFQYTILPVSHAESYTWSFPGGISIVSGTGTHSVAVDFDMQAVSGPVTVFGTNSCGNGPSSPPLDLKVYPIPPTPQVTVEGTTLVSSAPSGNQWYYSPDENGSGSSIEGATNQTFTPNKSGWYWTQVTLHGCSSDVSGRAYRLKPGEPNLYNLFPVPTQGVFTVAITTPDEQVFSIYIYNQLGQKKYERNGLHINGAYRETINLSPSPAGIYTILFKNGSGTTSRKFIISK